jgi:competence protein ComEC
MTPSRTFLYFCLSFIGGIFLSSFFNFSKPTLLGFLILGILLISVLWSYKKIVVFGFCLLFLVLGIWRHQVAEIQISKSKLQIYNDREEIITLVGIISTEPDIREKSQKLIVKIKEIQNLLALTHESIALFGGNPDGARVLVTTHRYPEYRYGDKLRITGKLKTPQPPTTFQKETFIQENYPKIGGGEDFNYKDYLKKDGIYSVMDWPKIELIERNQGNFVYAKILEFKNKLRESIYQNLSPPQSSILGAIILGDKRKISEEWKNKLNIAGVRHITAISGLHVTILTSILMTLLIGLGLWRQQAFYFALVLIALFIIMTGLQPSSIRAGIMGGLLLFAQYLGRMNTSSRTIVFAAALMLAQNPLLLKLDVGFQLSFLATMGIIYLGPIFQDCFLKWFPKKWFQKYLSPIKSIVSILVMTLSAYLFTLPILIYNFGYFSLVAPITNILILPPLPFIMGLGFIFGLAGIIFQPLGWILSWPCWLLLTYLTKIVDVLSRFSWSAYTLKISGVWLPISYLILGLLTWRLNESFTRPSFLR